MYICAGVLASHASQLKHGKLAEAANERVSSLSCVIKLFTTAGRLKHWLASRCVLSNLGSVCTATMVLAAIAMVLAAIELYEHTHGVRSFGMDAVMFAVANL